MNILFLGDEENHIIDFLKKENDVVVWDTKVNSEFISQFDYIISYGYTHIIKKDIIDASKNGIINLHISYLPWNRGSSPNLWSFIDKTRKGVTIHYIDEGIDTGDIIVQKELYFNEDNETLETSYTKLQKEIEVLFKNSWADIVNKNFKIKKQIEGEGTIHYDKDTYKIIDSIGSSVWKLPINELRKVL